MEKIKFMSEDMQEEAFYVLEQTTVNAVNYLLVADSEEDEAQCLILKETPSAEKGESVYEIVEDETELLAVSKVFEELLEDVSIEM